MRTAGAACSGDHLARLVWHQDRAITADQTGLQYTEWEEWVGGGGTKQLLQTQSHILGRTHQIGMRSGVRQSETKRTRMRRRRLEYPPHQCKHETNSQSFILTGRAFQNNYYKSQITLKTGIWR